MRHAFTFVTLITAELALAVNLPMLPKSNVQAPKAAGPASSKNDLNIGTNPDVGQDGSPKSKQRSYSVPKADRFSSKSARSLKARELPSSARRSSKSSISNSKSPALGKSSTDANSHVPAKPFTSARKGSSSSKASHNLKTSKSDQKTPGPNKTGSVPSSKSVGNGQDSTKKKTYAEALRGESLSGKPESHKPKIGTPKTQGNKNKKSYADALKTGLNQPKEDKTNDVSKEQNCKRSLGGTVKKCLPIVAAAATIGVGSAGIVHGVISNNAYTAGTGAGVLTGGMAGGAYAVSNYVSDRRAAQQQAGSSMNDLEPGRSSQQAHQAQQPQQERQAQERPQSQTSHEASQAPAEGSRRLTVASQPPQIPELQLQTQEHPDPETWFTPEQFSSRSLEHRSRLLKHHSQRWNGVESSVERGRYVYG